MPTKKVPAIEVPEKLDTDQDTEQSLQDDAMDEISPTSHPSREESEESEGAALEWESSPPVEPNRSQLPPDSSALRSGSSTGSARRRNLNWRQQQHSTQSKLPEPSSPSLSLRHRRTPQPKSKLLADATKEVEPSSNMRLDFSQSQLLVNSQTPKSLVSLGRREEVRHSPTGIAEANQTHNASHTDDSDMEFSVPQALANSDRDFVPETSLSGPNGTGSSRQQETELQQSSPAPAKMNSRISLGENLAGLSISQARPSNRGEQADETVAGTLVHSSNPQIDARSSNTNARDPSKVLADATGLSGAYPKASANGDYDITDSPSFPKGTASNPPSASEKLAPFSSMATGQPEDDPYLETSPTKVPAKRIAEQQAFAQKNLKRARRTVSNFGFSQDRPVREDPRERNRRAKRKYLEDLNLTKDGYIRQRTDIGMDTQHPDRSEAVFPPDSKEYQTSKVVSPSSNGRGTPRRKRQGRIESAIGGYSSERSDPRHGINAQPADSGPATPHPVPPEHAQERKGEPMKTQGLGDNHVFKKFCDAYPEYKGDLTHFIGLCRKLHKLVQAKAMPRPVWDDFIGRHKTDYMPYQIERTTRGEDSLSYEEFYFDKIEETVFKKRIMTPETLEMALEAGEAAVSRSNPTPVSESPRSPRRVFGSSPHTPVGALMEADHRSHRNSADQSPTGRGVEGRYHHPGHRHIDRYRPTYPSQRTPNERQRPPGPDARYEATGQREHHRPNQSPEQANFAGRSGAEMVSHIGVLPVTRSEACVSPSVTLQPIDQVHSSSREERMSPFQIQPMSRVDHERAGSPKTTVLGPSTVTDIPDDESQPVSVASLESPGLNSTLNTKLDGAVHQGGIAPQSLEKPAELSPQLEHLDSDESDSWVDDMTRFKDFVGAFAQLKTINGCLGEVDAGGVICLPPKAPNILDWQLK